MPHRGSAWALLEERVRDASTFCAAVIESSPEPVATALGAAQGTLTAVADSLAAHFGDWGAASRFTSGEGAAAPPVPASDEPLGFEQHILHRLDTGTMPCDGAWPAERVAVFRRWIDTGKAA
jgi:hypothetical protein